MALILFGALRYSDRAIFFTGRPSLRDRQMLQTRMCSLDNLPHTKALLVDFITGPPTHSVGGAVLFCSLASVVVVCRL